MVRVAEDNGLGMRVERFDELMLHHGWTVIGPLIDRTES